MQVYLNDERCDFETESVMEAVTNVSSLAQERGHMVVEIFVDEKQCQEEELAALDESATLIEEVRLVSADPVLLVEDTFADAATALTEVESLQLGAAECLENNQSSDAMDKLNQALSIWHQIQQAVSMGTTVLSRFGETKTSIDQFEKAIAHLEEQLRTLRSFLKNNDSIGLSDSLRYDLSEVVTHWREILQTPIVHSHTKDS